MIDGIESAGAKGWSGDWAGGERDGDRAVPLVRGRRPRSLPRTLRWRWLGIAVVLLALSPPVAAGDGPCLQAVFFDLGNTLVEDDGGGVFVLKPGAAETVASLQGLAVPLGIITNVPAGWDRSDLEAILAEPEFLDEFDVLVLSSEAPAPKPDPAIYTFAHGMLPGPPPIESTAFVGETLAEIADQADNPTSGARAVGMVGVHLSDLPPSPLADHTVSPSDLPAIAVLVANSCPLFADGFESGSTGAW